MKTAGYSKDGKTVLHFMKREMISEQKKLWNPSILSKFGYSQSRLTYAGGKVTETAWHYENWTVRKCVDQIVVESSWNVMAHAQKPDFVFRRNGRVHFNRRVHYFSRLLAAEVCASAVVMLDTPCSEVVWRVLATHYIRQFPLHFPCRASPCAVTLQLESTPDTVHNPANKWGLQLQQSVATRTF